MGIYKSRLIVYEVIASGVAGAAVIECKSDDEARTLAVAYAEKWREQVRLFAVPFINTSGINSHHLWPEHIREVAMPKE